MSTAKKLRSHAETTPMFQTKLLSSLFDLKLTSWSKTRRAGLLRASLELRFRLSPSKRWESFQRNSSCSTNHQRRLTPNWRKSYPAMSRTTFFNAKMTRHDLNNSQETLLGNMTSRSRALRRFAKVKSLNLRQTRIIRLSWRRSSAFASWKTLKPLADLKESSLWAHQDQRRTSTLFKYQRNINSSTCSCLSLSKK